MTLGAPLVMAMSNWAPGFVPEMEANVWRGLAAEAEGAFVKVVLIDDEGVVGVRVFVEAGGEDEPGAEVHVAAVEAAELVAAEPDEPKVAGGIGIGFLKGG